jgi:hypothetical protein
MTVIGHGYDDNVGTPAFRNLIVNGAMTVTQRGTSFTYGTGGGTLYFPADRFYNHDYLWSAGSNITVSNDTTVVPTGFTNSIKYATGATGLTLGADASQFFRTSVEGYNIAPHYKKTLTLSFWVRSSVTGTYCLFLANGNWGVSTATRALQQEYTINAANTWEKKTINIDMNTATSSGTWNTTNGIGFDIHWVLGAGTNRTGNAYKSGWTNYSALNFNTSTAVNFATNANATFYLTGVQLEAGPIATPFEFEPFETTLRKCQRYYVKSYTLSDTPATATNTAEEFFTGASDPYGNVGLTIKLPVEMRTVPSVSTYRAVPATSSVWDWYRSGATGTGAVTVDLGGTRTFRLYVYTGANSTICGIYGHWVASAEL